MSTRELQDALATKSMLQRFLADSTFGSDEGPLSSSPLSLEIEDTGHVSGAPAERGLISRIVIRALVKGALRGGSFFQGRTEGRRFDGR